MPAPAEAFLPPRALYVHVPLCAAKCGYCDFHSLPAGSLGEGEAEALVAATLGRVDGLASRFGARGFRTLYVGGGTPTALPPAAFAALMAGLARHAAGALEWTLEANPESLDARLLGLARDAGVTRISLGVQSLEEATLRFLGRRAGPREIGEALRLCAGSGLALSVDLIAGLPRAASLASEAERLLDAGAGHLSVYDLVLEEGTPLARRLAGGKARKEDPLPGEDEAADEREACEEFLAGRGFRRYEVSNYTPTGAEGLHNLAYWRLDSYVGAGPGAVSTLAGEDAAAPGAGGGSLRIEETRSLDRYRGGFAATDAREEAIPPRDSAFESLMMAFRTSFGLDLAAFRRRYGIEARDLIGRSLAAWAPRLVPGEVPPLAAAPVGPGGHDGGVPPGERLALDGRGLDLLNRFLADCLGELETRFPASPEIPAS